VVAGPTGRRGMRLTTRRGRPKRGRVGWGGESGGRPGVETYITDGEHFGLCGQVKDAALRDGTAGDGGADLHGARDSRRTSLPAAGFAGPVLAGRTGYGGAESRCGDDAARCGGAGELDAVTIPRGDMGRRTNAVGTKLR